MRALNKTICAVACTAAWVALALTGAPRSAAACSADAYAGTICMTAGRYCPQGYAEANGQVLQIVNYQVLFAVIGCTYSSSSDCRATFALPDLRGRAPVHSGSGPGLARVEMGQPIGASTLALDPTQMPQHDHQAAFQPVGGSDVIVTVPASSQPATDSVPGPGKVLAAVPTQGPGQPGVYAAGPGDTTLQPFPVTVPSAEGLVVVDPAGSGAGFSIQSPALGMRGCISVEGPFPPHPNWRRGRGGRSRGDGEVFGSV